jgi:hypothetical protein
MRVEYQIILIIFVHWIGDFLFQTFKMAMNKSKDNHQLFNHVLVYSCVWLFIGLFFYSVTQVLVFFVITFIFHFALDYGTSRWTSSLHKKEKFYGFPAFFSVIGLDQFLHYAQLILTFIYIKTL